MIIKLTLSDIRKRRPCKDGWRKLLKSLNKTKADETEVTFSYIAENNDVFDALWCLRCIDTKKHRKEISYLCADMAQSVLHIYEKEYPDDKRPRDCIQAVRDFADGKINKQELVEKRKAYAAAAAAYAAAFFATSAAAFATYAAAVAADAAADATYAADAADVSDASASVAASAATAATARAAEHKKQIQLIKKYLG